MRKREGDKLPDQYDIGPTWSYCVYLITHNFITWIALFSTAYAWSVWLRQTLYDAFEGTFLLKLLWMFHQTQWHLHFGVIMPLVLALIVGLAVVRKVTTRYEISRVQLVITRGIFTRYSDSISLAQIFDCDKRRNLFQMAFGGSDLIIKTIEERAEWLHFVSNADHWQRQLIMNSSASNIRMLGSI